MADRSRGLAVILYFAAGLCLVLLAIPAWFHLDSFRRNRLDSVAMAEPGARTKTWVGGSREDSSVAAYANSQVRMAKLRQALADTSQTLEEKTKLLKEKNVQCASLQAELDGSIALVIEMLDNRTSGSAADDAVQAIKADYESLKLEVREAQQLQQELARQVADLQTELMAAELEIAAREEAAANLQEELALERFAMQSLIQVGDQAVPALVALLSNESSRVREWAAYALGEIGMEAQDAAIPLVELLNDSDEAVRKQAKESLSLIAPSLVDQ